jgi:alanine-synthesizing transaminase
VFSGRTPASLAPGPFARRVAALRAEGRPLLDLAGFDPTSAELGYLDPELLQPLVDPSGLAHAPDPRGARRAREAVAAWYEARSLAVDPDDVVLVASTSEAYAHAFRLFADPGGRVLVPAPGYPLLDVLAAAEAVTLERYPFVAPTGDRPWRLDPDALSARLPGARATVAVHPGHPTGAFLARDEAAALAAACAAADVPLVVDEVFGGFHDPQAPGARPLDALRASFADETAATTLVLSGLSKVCGLPQLKLGWIVLAGPPARRDELRARLEWLADAFLSVGGPVQHALPALLEGAGRFGDAVAARVRANRETLAAAIARLEGAALLPSDGGWGAIVALPAPRSDEEWASALLEHDVVVHPGYWYEIAEPGRIVMSLLAPPDTFVEAIDTLLLVAR